MAFACATEKARPKVRPGLSCHRDGSDRGSPRNRRRRRVRSGGERAAQGLDGLVDPGLDRLDRLAGGLDRQLGNLGALGDERVERRLGEGVRSEEHTSELQSLMRISYAV